MHWVRFRHLTGQVEMYFRYNKDILFEYDESKSKLNRLKHGIDFEQAKGLWADESLAEVAVSFKDEMRML